MTQHLRCWILLLAMLLALPAPAAVVMGLGITYEATELGYGSFAIPPDCDGAVGPTNYVEFINGRFEVFGKTNATQIANTTDLAFWTQAGIVFPTNWDVTDPRIVYDPSSQRWFAAQIDFHMGGIITGNRFLVGVSQTSDPAGLWKAFAIVADPTGATEADFPTLGLDAQGVFLSASMFDLNNNLVGSTLVAIPKSSLLAATPSVTNYTRFSNLTISSRGAVLQPAVATDGSAGGNVLATGGLGLNLSTGRPITDTTLVAFAVQNAGGPGSATLGTSTFLTVPGYTTPLAASQVNDPNSIDVDDARFSATVYRVNGVLYAVQNTEVSGRAAIRWYRINAVTAAVLESGTITDPAMDLYYPSIAANTNGLVVIACNGSGLTNFIGCFAVLGETIKGVTRFGSLQRFQLSPVYYDQSPPSGVNRWGDYSTICVDPADPNVFWTIQMYAPGSTTWSTQVAQFLTAEVRLNATAAGTNLQLSWTSFAGEAQLQATTNAVSSNSWTVITPARSTNGYSISVQVPLTPAHQFFRLKL